MALKELSGMCCENILATVGRTPLVKLQRLNKNKNVDIYVKLEFMNPAGSVKDRIALSMIEAAEKSGELTKDKIILEATSGNTGIGLSMVAAVKGYKIALVMPENASIERQKIMRAYGADIILTPGKKATDGAIEEAYRLKREYPEKYLLLDQFNNENNWLIHYKTTGREIWEQTNGRVTTFVAALGTTGTVVGVGKRLKEYNENIEVVAVEPEIGHKIQGLKNLKESYKPGIFTKKYIDRIVRIRDEDAFETARLLAKKEGILVGMSSGAAVHVALEIAKEKKSGLIVVICPDSGERYLSTELFLNKSISNIYLYNTMTHEKEVFKPVVEGKVTIYTCGPTAGRYTTLEDLRRYIFADILHRYLEYNDFTVIHIVNITDIDDSIIERLARDNLEFKSFTEKYIQEYLSDMDLLRIKRADKYPRASEYVADMIDIARRLVDIGFAYEMLGSVYFDISKFKEYGKLSRINVSKIRTGMTIDLDEYEKDNPADFTLLRKCNLKELKLGIFYRSPWGNVKPGWHIECAAMSMNLLSMPIDIHTGSKRHIFPHHENEIAIAEALSGKKFVRYWLHNESVSVDSSVGSRDMSFRELMRKGYSARLIRFLYLTTHYRKTLYITEKSLYDARKSLIKLDEFIANLMAAEPKSMVQENGQINKYISNLQQRFEESMNNDLNTTRAIAYIFEFIKKINRFLMTDELTEYQKNRIISLLRRIDSVLNIFSFKPQKLDEKIIKLIKLRDEARKKKDWKIADKIRQQLFEIGVKLIDTAEGTRYIKIR